MYYTCVATITTKHGQMPDFLRKTELEALPLYRDLPGFVGYSITKISDVSAIAFSFWQTRDQAKHAIVASEKTFKLGADSLIDRIEQQVGNAPFVVFTGDLTATAATGASGAKTDVKAGVNTPSTPVAVR